MRNWMSLIFLGLVLIACSPADSRPLGPVESDQVRMAIGFYDDAATSLVLGYRGADRDAMLDVSVHGPSGWNNDKPYEMPFELEFGTFATLAAFTVPVPGTYRAVYELAGSEYMTSVHFDATSNDLAAPENLRITVARPSVHVSWDPVPGSGSYEVILSGPGVSFDEGWASTNSTSVTFTLEDESLFDANSDYTVSIGVRSEGYFEFVTPANRRWLSSDPFVLND